MGKIRVSATGHSTAAPDIVTVQAGISVEGLTARQAMDNGNKLMRAVLGEMEALGIGKADIQTSRFNLRAKHDHQSKSGPKIAGYEVDNMVRITSRDLERIGEILDALVTAGVNAINNVSYRVKDDLAARREARDLAIQHARTIAENMAESAGVGLGDLVKITLLAQNTVHQPRGRAMMASAGAPMAAGENTISASVEMVFKTKPR